MESQQMLLIAILVLLLLNLILSGVCLSKLKKTENYKFDRLQKEILPPRSEDRSQMSE